MQFKIKKTKKESEFVWTNPELKGHYRLYVDNVRDRLVSGDVVQIYLSKNIYRVKEVVYLGNDTVLALDCIGVNDPESAKIARYLKPGTHYKLLYNTV